jgi:hypothetical protein
VAAADDTRHRSPATVPDAAVAQTQDALHRHAGIAIRDQPRVTCDRRRPPAIGDTRLT